MTKLMTQAQLADIKARVLFRDFEKINSVMAGRSVKVRGNPGHPQQKQPPAWSEVVVPGKNAIHRVTFSTQEKAFDVNSVEGVIGITGLNYHELAHVLYTQGASTPDVSTTALPATALRSRVASSGDPRLAMIRAILEDMRIERKFIAEYGPTKPYFQSVVGRFLLDTDDKKAQSRQYILLAARDHVDKPIRDAYRKMFVDETSEKVAKAYTILANQFADLDFVSDEDVSVGLEIIKKVSSILGNDDLVEASKDSPFHGGTSNVDPANPAGDEGRQERAYGLNQFNDNDPEDREQEAGEVAANGDSEDSGDEGDESGSGSGEDADDEGAEGSGGGASDDDGEEGDEEGTGSESDDDDDDADDSDDDHESEDGGGKSDTSGDGDDVGSGVSKGGDGSKDSDWDSNECIQQMVNRAENNESVLEEVAQKQRSLRSLDRPGQALTLGMRRGNGASMAIEPEMQLISKRVSQEFRQLQVDLDPGRKPYQPSGVVSMKRAMKGVDYDTVFDSWDEGQQDASDMEVVLLTDMSGSMSYHSTEMSRAVWIIQRAIQMASTSSVVSVVGYGSEAGYLQGRGNRVNPNTYTRYSCTDNGTSPLKALEEAVALFATTKRQKRVLIVLTDGMWDEPMQCDRMFHRMNAAGVVTSTFLYIGSVFGHQIQSLKQPLPVRATLLGHDARIYQESTDMSDLIGFAKKVVTTAMKEN